MIPFRRGGPRLILYHLTYPIAMLVAVAVALAIGDAIVRDTADATYRRNAETVARTVRNLLPEAARFDRGAADAFARRGAGDTGTRITIIAADGTVLGDSHADASEMENHSVRPEVRVALGGEVGVIRRYSSTVGRNLVYAALPVFSTSTGAVEAVVRTALTVDALSALTGDVRVQLGATGTMLIAVTLAITMIVSELIRRPLKRLHTAAERLSTNPAAQPEFGHISDRGSPREIAQLAHAFDTLTRELTRRVREVDEQRRETEQVLNTIREPLLLLDDATRILRLNDAGSELAAQPAADCIGRTVLEVFRNSDLDHFVRTVVDGDAIEETQVVAYGSTERHLQAWGVRIPSTTGLLTGHTLILIRDVTPEYERERIRRDFVANVSHELKTPLTMIHGAVETLADIDSAHEEDRRRFEDMIRSNTDRMSAIVEDLLNLARIEQTGTRIATEPVEIHAMLSAIVQDDAQLRPAPHAPVTIDVDETLVWPIDQSLAELAVRNLINNALAYTALDGSVRVEARIENGALYLSVTDTGAGIPATDLPRLFERFYRVDRSRARDRGGTGLGLSLVQHVAHVHGGSAHVESSLGSGSTFTLMIPGGTQ
ncbi:MAG TPA: ATP-binding protein [Alkalispirochaeta sp.]|nr:ATP-binding protein [Alkalispirochaeta sp.]